ncbi:MAG: class I SAM-dependent methyltransferase [Deltaproteobacteria bacterium]|nr:class I SAM-dependent methyltransferase [Deltaproteobacteria bacterium]MBI3389208.1 class I SAM-dependent methyltransferase [Deltaproteobacteria bacterium]
MPLTSIMYSTEWFETFAATVPTAIVAVEINALAAILPLEQHARILDIGCGIGRITGPLSSLGYTVTGLDISVEALLSAKSRAPGPRYVALDQQHIGRMRWEFDAALFMWNSLGFVGRGADLETLTGVAKVLRPGGKVVFDLYHPDWLRQNERAGEADRGAVSVRRWMRGSRCLHEIRYDSGRVDDIQFDVYQPDEIRDLSRRAGLEPVTDMVWWDSDSRPSANSPRYQLICVSSVASAGRI